MNNKILVTISIPVSDQEYDVYIPVFKNIGICIDLIIKSISELSNGHFPSQENYTLITENGDILDKNKTIKESNIKNGTKLLLI